VRIGLISDTHLPSTIREPWPEVGDVFSGVDLILHAGDIVAPRVLDWLEQIAPVLAARGDWEGSLGDSRIADVQRLEVGGWRIAMTHDMEPEDRPVDRLVARYLSGEDADVIVTGHTHFERIAYRSGVLQINPGSATHPHQSSTRLGTVGLLELAAGRSVARVIRLGETPGLRNPGRELFFDSDSAEGGD
jgi:uncharacterized protein